MKKFLGLIIGVFLFAFSARVEPYDTFTIKSSIAGSVVFCDKKKEAGYYKGLIVKIDDNQEKIELNKLLNQKKFLQEEIENQKEILKRKFDTYRRYKNLKTKSVEEKNIKFYDYIAAKNQLINLKNQLNGINASIEKLKDTINKKNIKVNGYVDKVLVNKGDYVAPGTPVVKIDDISLVKLNVYVPLEKIDKIKNKKIYIDGKKRDFKIEKIWKVPDDKYITSYKVEIVGKGLKIGEIVNVEFKN